MASLPPILFLLMLLPSLTFSIKRPHHPIDTRLHSAFVTMKPHKHQQWQRKRKASESNGADSSSSSPPIYRAQGLVAIHKPLTWTSQDVVSYVRGILTRDAEDRKAFGGGGGHGGRKKKKQMLKVGHGGTLDPLASGVLVLGIGSGTTKLQSYLEGDKRYVAACELGYETTTLDAEGDIVKEMGYDRIKSVFADKDAKTERSESTQPTSVESALPKFRGKISQVPPLYSAIRVDGKRLYEIARKEEGKSNDDDKQQVEIPTRQVEIYELSVDTKLDDDVLKSGVVNGREYRKVMEEKMKELNEAKEAEDSKPEVEESDAEEKDGNGKGKMKGKRKKGKKETKKNNLFTDATVPTVAADENEFNVPQFTLSISCGGGTYVRSLVRDIGYECGSVATMTGLVRVKQGPFVLADALRREEWTADKIYEAIERNNNQMERGNKKTDG